MYRDKTKDKKTPPAFRPTPFQQYKEEIGDDVLPDATTKILQQKYGISNAEIISSEKDLIEREASSGRVFRGR